MSDTPPPSYQSAAKEKQAGSQSSGNQQSTTGNATVENQSHYGYPQQAGYQQAGYQQAAYQPVQPVAVPVAVPAMGMGTANLGEAATRMTCQFCGADIMTNTQYVIGVTVWIIAAVLFITCLWLCIFIPFVTNACKDVKHSCPNCNNQIGVYKRC
ncbi:hypothetical protein BOX15_Mlig011028g2 [Macrostomum lignano]|uniref:LITAF domain-containing protein n=1 Tax=Macrostomum lignano TaxID=282301 RepID=A0A267FWG7_9PLAT|nr:hypothetical protein BOX15_Mlig011028g2 [Macrostomum lignano]